MPYAEFITKEVKQRAWKTRRRLVRYLPHLRDIERFAQPRDIAKEAMDACPEAFAMVRGRSNLARDEVQEIISEAAMAAVLQDRAGKALTNLVGFMATVAKNRIIDATRTAWHKNRVHFSDADHDKELERWSRRGPEGFAEDPMEILMKSEEEELDRIALKNRFNQLNHGPRRCYLLRAEGLSNDQVAQRLGISVHTVERHLQKVFDHLRVSPTGRERRTLLVPLDLTRHHYGLNVRKMPKEVLNPVRKRA